MKPDVVRGKDLKRDEFEKALKVEYHPEARYAWDSGYAVGKFLEGLKEGKILGVRCRKCRRVMVPPRAFCELCFVPIDEWVELKDTGRINTYSVSYISMDVKRLRVPEIPAVIEIDGASPGMGILHKLDVKAFFPDPENINPDEIKERIKIGMRVKAVWKKPEERQGAITDIICFTPVE